MAVGLLCKASTIVVWRTSMPQEPRFPPLLPISMSQFAMSSMGEMERPMTLYINIYLTNK